MRPENVLRAVNDSDVRNNFLGWEGYRTAFRIGDNTCTRRNIFPSFVWLWFPLLNECSPQKLARRAVDFSASSLMLCSLF